MIEGFSKVLREFIVQAEIGDLKTASYPKTLADLEFRISFGMGAPARVPWMAFLAPGMAVSRGFYPVYLYYKAKQKLILAYGVSETEEFEESWPIEVQNESDTIAAYLGTNVPRYGDSFVFKGYNLKFSKAGDVFVFEYDDGRVANEKGLEADLGTLIDYYQKAVLIKVQTETSTVNRGLFYMEKQLEDFIIHNWANTELGEKYDLIIEDGELLSQQFRTEIGPIDILARDKKTKDYVVVELKRNQTSDDTVGQHARYMSWIKEKKGTNVKGVIIAGSYDKKLDYALKMVPNTEVFLYEVSFKLGEFKA